MMQGDSYNIGIQILNNAGSVVTPNDVQEVEVTIAGKTKRYTDGNIIYTNGKWGYPISQTESMDIYADRVRAQVRVKWNDGAVEGQELTGLRLSETMSREVI